MAENLYKSVSGLDAENFKRIIDGNVSFTASVMSYKDRYSFMFHDIKA